MREERLLERLSGKGRRPGVKSVHEMGRLMDSIAAHLQRLFNTRQGCTQMDPELGLHDYTDFIPDYPDSLDLMEESIRRIVRSYEPRIRDVRVEFSEREEYSHILHFQISGVLRGESEGIPVVLESRLNPDGNMQVRR